LSRKPTVPISCGGDAVPLLHLNISVAVCVDLDGTLIRSDTLWETLWALRKYPRDVLAACLSIRKGRAAFKQHVAALGAVSPRELPYNQDLLDFLTGEARAGRQLLLTTAADAQIASSVAQYLGIFDRTIASDGVANCKGQGKADAIRKVCPRFVYVGDSIADLPVWRASEGAIIVGSYANMIGRLLHHGGITVYRQFPPDSSLLRIFGRAIRVHQWPKNVLVFLPVILGHKTNDPLAWTTGALVLAVFCVAASAAYLINDLADLEADRQHASKCSRPLACGDLSLPKGVLLLVGLIVTGILLCVCLPAAAQAWVATYFALTLLYSFYVKTILLADVVALAVLYALRVMAGGAATGIAISPWTLAFCMFVFYSLALVKRYGELRALSNTQTAPARRAYRKEDLPVVATLGASSGLLSVVIFSIYISSPDVRLHYCSPGWLWLICPVILFWFGRLWILANRGTIAEDPMLFSLKDPVTYLMGGCVALVWFAASACL
jgi:4-hydroxybenzoate polyprenyltransferase